MAGAAALVMSTSCSKQDATPPVDPTSTTAGSVRPSATDAPTTAARSTGTSAATGTRTTGDDPSTAFFTVAGTLPDGQKWDAYTDKGGQPNGKFRARVDYNGPNGAEIQVYGPDATVEGSTPLAMAAGLVTQGQLTGASTPKMSKFAGQDAAMVTGAYNGKSVIEFVTGNTYGTFVARLDSPPAELTANATTFQAVVDSTRFNPAK